MPGKMAKAELTAVKKTMKTAKTRIAQDITGEANLTSKDVKSSIKQTRSPSEHAPSGRLTISGSQISLWKYSRSKSELAGFASQEGTETAKRKPKMGASWKIFKGGKKTRHKRFFIDKNTGDGQISIYKRGPKSKGGKAAKPGTDYRTAYGPSLAWIMKRRNLKPPLVAELIEVLDKNLRSQVDRFLKRKKK